MDGHHFYNQLTRKERAFVDDMFSRENFKRAKDELGFDLRGDDTVEEAVEAVSKWVYSSRAAALA